MCLDVFGPRVGKTTKEQGRLRYVLSILYVYIYIYEKFRKICVWRQMYAYSYHGTSTELDDGTISMTPLLYFDKRYATCIYLDETFIHTDMIYIYKYGI